MVWLVLMAAHLAYPLLSTETNTALAKAPKEIGTFMERRAECAHWAGEEPYDKARGEEIERAENKLKCADALDANERALRRKYAKHPDILRLLNQEY